MINIKSKDNTINKVNDCLNISVELISKSTGASASKVCETVDFKFLGLSIVS